MADPVSWFVVERGWKVAGSDKSDLGRVVDTLGDESMDIFDGLVVATGLLGKPRYVPAELVGEIVEGEVRLTIDQRGFEQLDEYDEPPPKPA